MAQSRRALRALGQVALGGALLAAGAGHLTSQREEFQAQVPPWVPLDPDLVVVASGVVELGLGATLLAVWRQPVRGLVGAAVAAFFVAVFPGNVAQLTERRDAFGLDSDAKRAVRLVFQPVLVAWALTTTGAVGAVRQLRASS
ncbi:hypothetical protein KZX45_13060 [Georgenia sp. EYE_87]|uniref:DoxX family protein n=1 Tax=Georgenia sp. EYE_87 TaxID=2853448 RepID=UPI00200416B2|nr:hypothetical protein [Georgenia sp. EYE_87]MCK6211473.1 hypothetical protein [Georgenia sp. EYE_87]